MNRTQKKTLVLLLGILVGLGILLAVLIQRMFALQSKPTRRMG